MAWLFRATAAGDDGEGEVEGFGGEGREVYGSTVFCDSLRASYPLCHDVFSYLHIRTLTMTAFSEPTP
jgi:hypothetical protein